MGRQRPRYNAAARQSSQSSKNAKPHENPRKPTISTSKSNDEDEYIASNTSNPLILPAKSSNKNSIQPEPQKMSSKKRKRFEKFVEKQEKKQKHRKLLDKLAKEHKERQSELDDTSKSLFLSSKTIGSGGTVTKKQKLKRAFLESKLGIDLGADEIAKEQLIVEVDVPEPVKVSEKANVKKTADDDLHRFDDWMDDDSSEEEPGPVFGGALKSSKPQELPSARVSKLAQKKKLREQRRKERRRHAKESNAIANDSPDSQDSNSDTSDSDNSKHSTKNSPQRDPTPEYHFTPMKPAPPQKVIPQKPKSELLPHEITTENLPTGKFIQPLNSRPDYIQQQRLMLPILAYQGDIVDSILHNPVVIICGATGSGKTTQVPQILYEYGFSNPKHPLFPGQIIVTEPRRVAAISTAKRVQEEMGSDGKVVGWQVRYDKTNVTSQTQIKFCTDGILLRELTLAASSGDLLLQQYSCIILDEAHERTLGTDVLIGWLSRIVKLRNSDQAKQSGIKPLRLVIMSATLRVADFTENKVLFPDGNIPVLNVEGRQFQVTVHFNRKTPQGPGAYVQDAFKKVCKIHEKLPGGAILVFLTGQQEIAHLCHLLREKYGRGDGKVEKMEEVEFGGLDEMDKDEDFQPVGDDYEEDSEDSEEEDVVILSGDEGDEIEEMPLKLGQEKIIKPVHVLPLHSLLPTASQLKIFETPPEGSRLIVVATNIAETSLTIPGVRYVVDAGKVKSRDYDVHTGIQRFVVGWTSQASADQRAGRAGRTGPGHAYRLFSSAVYSNNFQQWSDPEILKTPIEGVVLQMKDMGIHQVVNFPFPTPPDRSRLKLAEKLLIHLGALDGDTVHLDITPMGKLMAKFPISPRFAKMIVMAAQQPVENLLAHVIGLVAGMSVGEIFKTDEKPGEYYKTMAMFAGEYPTSDALRLLSAIGAFEYHRHRRGAVEEFCDKHFLRLKAMEEVGKLRGQLTNLIKMILMDNDNVKKLILDPKMAPPDSTTMTLIRQLIFAAFPDQVARLSLKPGKRPMYDVMIGSDDPVYIHPESCLANLRPPPSWVCWQEIVGKQHVVDVDGTSLLEGRGEERNLLRGVTIMKESWPVKLAPRGLCNITSILEQPHPKYYSKEDKITAFVASNYGPQRWELPLQEVDFPVGKDAPTGAGMSEKIRWFARFLLEGKVLGRRGDPDLFSLLAPMLDVKPSSITKPWAKNVGKIGDLLKGLQEERVDGREKLLQVWKEKPKFLMEAYLIWLPTNLREVVREHWPFVKMVEGGWKNEKGDLLKIGKLLGVGKRVEEEVKEESFRGYFDSESE